VGSGRMARFAAWCFNLPLLFAGVYPAEKTVGLGDLRWRVSWRGAADDWLGGGGSSLGWRRLAALFDPVLLAIPALQCDRLDLSRRLRARGDSHVVGRRCGRFANVPADIDFIGNTGSHKPAAVGSADGRYPLLFWRVDCEHRPGAGVPLGRQEQKQYA